MDKLPSDWQERLDMACQGNTYSSGGLNKTHLVVLAKEAGISGTSGMDRPQLQDSVCAHYLSASASTPRSASASTPRSASASTPRSASASASTPRSAPTPTPTPHVFSIVPAVKSMVDNMCITDMLNFRLDRNLRDIIDGYITDQYQQIVPKTQRSPDIDIVGMARVVERNRFEKGNIVGFDLFKLDHYDTIMSYRKQYPENSRMQEAIDRYMVGAYKADPIFGIRKQTVVTVKDAYDWYWNVHDGQSGSRRRKKEAAEQAKLASAARQRHERELTEATRLVNRSRMNPYSANYVKPSNHNDLYPHK